MLIGCGDTTPNNPYPSNQAMENIYYSAFSERPKYLDPARSYSADESTFTSQIYEPPLQYHYLKRPYELEPRSAAAMPKVTYFDDAGNVINGETFPDKVAKTTYEVQIQPGIMFQPHPAFAKTEQGEPRYYNLDGSNLNGIESLEDFEFSGTRELFAEDFVYEIKRLAYPAINSPIFSLMSKHIEGLSELNDALKNDEVPLSGLRDYPFEGAIATGPYTFEIHIKGLYPQFKYWLAMPFFAPVPWEADVFYAQQALIDRNIVLNWFPIGTGPYMLTENDPNRHMVLSKNPNFRGEVFEGEPIPHIDRLIYTLEKESIPRWNKFLQGYYDMSGISSENFDQAIETSGGESFLTPELTDKDISLMSEIMIADFYWGFNMMDNVVGGYDEKQQKLRQAISIAIDIDEYISIFMNNRGQAAQNILPPGIFGSDLGLNPYVYNLETDPPQRHSIDYARKLLSEAGYPNGRDPNTGQPLVIDYAGITSGDPIEKSRHAWMRKQFQKLGIDLNVFLTDYNRFRVKMENGDFQIFFLGWLADYPDPENFLFLLYGPNGKLKYGGENSTNYDNPRFNGLFEQAKVLPDNEARKTLIKEMVNITQQDAPIVWGFHPQAYTLKHDWVKNVIPSEMIRNAAKYYKVVPEIRADKRNAWNSPVFWPLVFVLIGLLALIIPVYVSYSNKEKRVQTKRFK